MVQETFPVVLEIVSIPGTRPTLTKRQLPQEDVWRLLRLRKEDVNVVHILGLKSADLLSLDQLVSLLGELQPRLLSPINLMAAILPLHVQLQLHHIPKFQLHQVLPKLSVQAQGITVSGQLLLNIVRQ